MTRQPVRPAHAERCRITLRMCSGRALIFFDPIPVAVQVAVRATATKRPDELSTRRASRKLVELRGIEPLTLRLPERSAIS